VVVEAGKKVSQGTPSPGSWVRPIETIDEVGECGGEAIIPAEEPENMEVAYHVTGDRRKELVKAIIQFACLAATC
jgi:hypothetical protein